MRKLYALALLATGSCTFAGCGGSDDYSGSPTNRSFADAAASYAQVDEGIGPGRGGDKYDRIVEHAMLRAKDRPLSTFSIDVDTASYSKVRMYLTQHGQMPPKDAVRIEELINYFDYDYDGPQDEHPFAVHLEVAECPWQPEHRLVRIGIKGKEMQRDQTEGSNLVLLIDKSGSMSAENKLPLVRKAMRTLVQQLDKNDLVSIVVYASGVQLWLRPTRGDKKRVLFDAIDRLEAGGATAGGAALELAYDTAQANFIRGGVNRVVLCTDGDFNVGTTSTAALVRMVEEKAKRGIYMTVLGFGMGNHNDAMLEQISNNGGGNYAFIDTELESRKVLAEQLNATLVTIAKDVKIQVEFNPAQVAAYRQIGYENRQLAAEDFQDDKKDAGEIGAGHCVTALYEIVPAASNTKVPLPNVKPLKYQIPNVLTAASKSGELLTVRLRYKLPDENDSREIEFALRDELQSIGQASADLRFAAAVASYGMLLRDSRYKGNFTYDSILEIAKGAIGKDVYGYRAEFLQMVKVARRLDGAAR